MTAVSSDFIFFVFFAYNDTFFSKTKEKKRIKNHSHRSHSLISTNVQKKLYKYITVYVGRDLVLLLEEDDCQVIL